MSQFWSANWADDAFKPTMLRNWETPNWHPKWPCRRHCVTTTIIADNSGRILPNQPRSKRSPWGDFKSTWQLPPRISRNMAYQLSATPKWKIAAWEAHKRQYEGPCGFTTKGTKKGKKGKVATSEHPPQPPALPSEPEKIVREEEQAPENPVPED